MQSVNLSHHSDLTSPNIHVFGSYATDLAVPNLSDLDLVILSPERGTVLDPAARCTLIGEGRLRNILYSRVYVFIIYICVYSFE